VGDREDVFSGLPSALLLPPGASYKLRAQTPLHLAIVSAPAESAPPARLVRPDEVRIEIRGKGITERKIHWILYEQEPAARLVLVPRGYHVVSAAPGYDCYYLNAMAGAVREWLFTTDPDHEWLMDWNKS